MEASKASVGEKFIFMSQVPLDYFQPDNNRIFSLDKDTL